MDEKDREIQELRRKIQNNEDNRGDGGEWLGGFFIGCIILQMVSCVGSVVSGLWELVPWWLVGIVVIYVWGKLKKK